MIQAIKYSALLVFCLIYMDISAQNVGIGTTTPSANLHVNGTLKVTDGSQGDGKILTSDAAGLATWRSTTGSVGFGAWGDCSLNNISEYNPIGISDSSIGFGHSIAIDGNYAMVASPNDTIGGFPAAGSVNVYFFNGTNWVLVTKISNPEPAFNEFFGGEVAISGNYAVIGNGGDVNGGFIYSGAAYLYNIGTNSLTKIVNPSPAISSWFGYSVGISGNNVIIGAYGDNNGVFNRAGDAYIYNISSTLLTKINNPDPATNDYFGDVVRISGNYAVITADQDDNNGFTNDGAIYIYNISTSNIVKVTPPNPANNELFGELMSLSGNNLIISPANGTDIDGLYNMGTVYIYDISTGIFHNLNNPDPSLHNFWGYNVMIAGNYAMVGSWGDTAHALYRAGNVYLYQNMSGYWRLVQKFCDPYPSTNQGFGIAVAIDSATKRFLVGSSISAFVSFGKLNL